MRLSANSLVSISDHLAWKVVLSDRGGAYGPGTPRAAALDAVKALATRLPDEVHAA
ncbi:hypothetical protein [Streptomyces sp. NPDC088261]|uniref:hypothetical protein n=1 Tax=Streptomyces sp. NPDC088261 TaxID=3365851 RepID=UPI0037FE51D9